MALPFLAPQAEVQRRRELCAQCPQQKPHPKVGYLRCEQCGCFITAKTLHKSATCPLHKW